MKKSIPLILSLLFLLNNAFAQVGTVKDVDEYLKRYLDKIPVPGFSIVIVEGQEVKFAKGYGVESQGFSKRMTPQSTMAIGSLARGFTAIAVMQLVEEGLVDLDEPIVSYLPWFQTANKDFSDQITLRMCLSNTSGIPPQYESLPDLENATSAESFLRSLKGAFIKRKPGMSHEFCDEGYAIAGEVISSVSGMSYSEYVASNILRPLKMTRTAAEQEVADQMNIVYGHEMGKDQCYPAVKGITDANFIAAGSEFYSSAEDLGNYMIALLNSGTYKGERIVSSESVAEIFKPNTSFEGLGTMLGGNGIDIDYALGWMGMVIEERDILIHTGNNGNVASIMGINKVKDQAFVMLFNADVNRLNRFKYPGMEHTVNNVIHILNAEDTTDFGIMRQGLPNDDDYLLPKDKWDKYIGKYESFGRPSPFFKNMNIEVFVGDDGGLELISKRQTEFKGHYGLQFTNESRALLKNIAFERQIQFSINPEGEVSGLFMFGSEFKKENKALAKRFSKTVDPNKTISFLLPKNATERWKGDELSATFDDVFEMTLTLSTAELKAIGFESFVNSYISEKEVTQKGILNKEVLKKGVWTEQTIIIKETNGPVQYHFAFYQDPISNKQMQLVLNCPWGAHSNSLQEVMANIHKSVHFE